MKALGRIQQFEKGYRKLQMRAVPFGFWTCHCQCKWMVAAIAAIRARTCASSTTLPWRHMMLLQPILTCWCITWRSKPLFCWHGDACSIWCSCSTTASTLGQRGAKKLQSAKRRESYGIAGHGTEQNSSWFIEQIIISHVDRSGSERYRRSKRDQEALPQCIWTTWISCVN